MKNIGLAALAALLSSISAAPAMAGSCTGNCGVLGANGDVPAPPPAAGSATYNWVSTNGGVAGAGQITSAGGEDGSEYLSDIFTAKAADKLDFFFNYVTSDGTGQYVDYSFAELLTVGGDHVAYLFTARTNPSGDTSPGFGLPANDSVLNPSPVGVTPGATNWLPLGLDSEACYKGLGNGCGNTGWIESTFVPGAGDYRLRLGVTNFGDSQFQSGLAFAGVTIGGVTVPTGDVPEPASWALMLLGFGGIGSMLRRRLKAPISTFA